jgi:hypothetical protein
LIAISSRSDDIAALIIRRLTTLAHSGLNILEPDAVRAVVRQAVRDVRAAPPLPPAGSPTDPGIAALRRAVDDLFAASYAIGELMLEVAPAYLSDTDAVEVLAPLCAAIGESLENGLAARRYALSGDRRALDGVL